MVTNLINLELSGAMKNCANKRIIARYKNEIIKLQGNDLVTEITANFAFLCFIPHYFKNNRFCNPLITFFLPAFASSLKNTCGSLPENLTSFVVSFPGRSYAETITFPFSEVKYGTVAINRHQSVSPSC